MTTSELSRGDEDAARPEAIPEPGVSGTEFHVAEMMRGLISRNPTMMRWALRLYGRMHGCDVAVSRERVAVKHRSSERCVVLNAGHAVYARDVVDNFDFYFEAVEPTTTDPIATVDYSEPRLHRVRGWDLMSIEFPSLAEPFATAQQYLDFAQLEPGQTVLDLGAYSGFTAIVFQEAVGPAGTVVAVDADRVNLASARKNLEHFRAKTGLEPTLVELAIWSHSDGLDFLTEGNMGSAVASLLHRGKENVRHVPSSTLSDLAERFELNDVAFIKADIEGAELAAFSDKRFFQDHHPRIIFEAVTQKDYGPQIVIDELEKYGYSCRISEQFGARTPLVECV